MALSNGVPFVTCMTLQNVCWKEALNLCVKKCSDSTHKSIDNQTEWFESKTAEKEWNKSELDVNGNAKATKMQKSKKILLHLFSLKLKLIFVGVKHDFNVSDINLQKKFYFMFEDIIHVKHINAIRVDYFQIKIT